jgi:hypothetical protein
LNLRAALDLSIAYLPHLLLILSPVQTDCFCSEVDAKGAFPLARSGSTGWMQLWSLGSPMLAFPAIAWEANNTVHAKRRVAE